LNTPKLRCLYIGKSPPPPPRGNGNISRCNLGEKNMKIGREKRGKCKRKKKRGKKNYERGEEKEERAIKMIK
jgi:hypothetical protein